jgi:type IV secretory pathway TrbD component
MEIVELIVSEFGILIWIIGVAAAFRILIGK